VSDFDSVRVVDEPTAIKLVGVSPRTWDRMRARGETPPVTKLSARRIGYRVSDLAKWLDARRVTTVT
jgi:predicted DNA-binding transcriptional regulator AlpA